MANIVLTSECGAPSEGLDKHEARIKPLWDAAFRGPIVHEYTVGQIVWLYDHYNTGRIVRLSGTRPGGHKDWVVETSDADGTVHQFEYQAPWLRPATEECVFHWPNDATEAGRDPNCPLEHLGPCHHKAPK